MTERKDFLNAIRRLEAQVGKQAGEIVLLEEQVDLQGEDTFEIAGAVMQIRKEDAAMLANYKKQNTILVGFVEKIADSKSKFGKEARQILGF